MDELIKSLSDQSPMLAVVSAFGVWIMRTVVQPLTQRHIVWMDSMEQRDMQKTAILTGLENNLEQLREIQKEHYEICRSGVHGVHSVRQLPNPKPA